MKKAILVLSAVMLASCAKDEITTHTTEEEFVVAELNSRQLNRAWDIPSNDVAMESMLTSLSQENVIVTDTWDRSGNNSRQALILIRKDLSSLPIVDGIYKFYDTDDLTHLDGLNGNYLAMILVDGVTRTITSDTGLNVSIEVERGKVYYFSNGELKEYN